MGSFFEALGRALGTNWIARHAELQICKVYTIEYGAENIHGVTAVTMGVKYSRYQVTRCIIGTYMGHLGMAQGNSCIVHTYVYSRVRRICKL